MGSNPESATRLADRRMARCREGPGSVPRLRSLIEAALVVSIALPRCHDGQTTPITASSVQPPPAPCASESARPPKHLKIATWNIEWLDADEGQGSVKRTQADYDRLRDYANRLGADIVALQEVDGKQAAERVFDPDTYAVHMSSSGRVQSTGFAYRKTLQVTPNDDAAELDVGGVRRGTDITVELEGSRQLRLLAVHLKSGCFEAALDSTDDCEKLKLQLPVLEKWIDDRATEGVAFVVLGDFNRRLFKRPDDEFWIEIDDSEPADADLSSPTNGRMSNCWMQRHPHFVSHLVFSKSAWALADPASFAELIYDAADSAHESVLSDHCPISIELTAAGSTAGLTDGGRIIEIEASADPPPNDRPIKGNISSDGRKLYHLPECPSYETTKIDESKGERFFATETEAVAAGWTKAGNCP